MLAACAPPLTWCTHTRCRSAYLVSTHPRQGTGKAGRMLARIRTIQNRNRWGTIPISPRGVGWGWRVQGSPLQDSCTVQGTEKTCKPEPLLQQAPPTLTTSQQKPHPHHLCPRLRPHPLINLQAPANSSTTSAPCSLTSPGSGCVECWRRTSRTLTRPLLPSWPVTL